MPSSDGEKDPGAYDPANEEVADFAELDYDYTSVADKIAAGTKSKEAGNKLFRAGEYEKAWKQYDRAFVHIYTSKEEWEAIGAEWRNAINRFKLPCHLNRGLCRMKRDDLDTALWDFSEALRIEPDNAKGLYRRGNVLTKMVRADVRKEEEGEVWSLEKAEGDLEKAREDLMKAVRLQPNDVNIRKAIAEAKEVKTELAKHRKKYQTDQKALFSNLISNLDKDNQRKKDEEDKEIFKDMPKLERIRIG